MEKSKKSKEKVVSTDDEMSVDYNPEVEQEMDNWMNEYLQQLQKEEDKKLFEVLSNPENVLKVIRDNVVIADKLKSYFDLVNPIEETPNETQSTTSSTNTQEQNDLKLYGSFMTMLDEIAELRENRDGRKTETIASLNSTKLDTIEIAIEVLLKAEHTFYVKTRESRISYLLGGRSACFIESQSKTTKWQGMKSKDKFCKEKLKMSSKKFDRMKTAYEIFGAYPELFCNSSWSIEDLNAHKQTLNNFFTRCSTCKDGDKIAGKEIQKHYKKQYWNQNWDEFMKDFKR